MENIEEMDSDVEKSTVKLPTMAFSSHNALQDDLHSNYIIDQNLNATKQD